jgi:hypothetical protein
MANTKKGETQRIVPKRKPAQKRRPRAAAQANRGQQQATNAIKIFCEFFINVCLDNMPPLFGVRIAENRRH